MNETDFAWLAGAVDGEGHLDASFRNVGKGALRSPGALKCLQVRISITNTKPIFINKVIVIFKELTVPFNIHVDTRTRKNAAFTVAATGRKNLRKLLPKIIPYLTCKKEEAEQLLLLLDYLDSRPTKKQGASEFIFEDPQILQKMEQIKQIKYNDFVKVDEFLAVKQGQMSGLT